MLLLSEGLTSVSRVFTWSEFTKNNFFALFLRYDICYYWDISVAARGRSSTMTISEPSRSTESHRIPQRTQNNPGLSCKLLRVKTKSNVNYECIREPQKTQRQKELWRDGRSDGWVETEWLTTEWQKRQGYTKQKFFICGNKTPTRCNRRFLSQILLLAQRVSGTIMPIIRSSRVLYKWLLPVVFDAWFSSCRYGVVLRVVCPVCGLLRNGPQTIRSAIKIICCI